MLAALAAQRRNDLDAAERLYEEALGFDPTNVDALHMLGVVHFTRGDIGKAEQYIRHALAHCTEPVPNINHNLMMVKEARAAKSTTDSVAIRLVRESDVASVARSTRLLHAGQVLTIPSLSESGKPTSGFQSAHFPEVQAYEIENAVVDAEGEFASTDTFAILPDWIELHRHEPSEFRYGIFARSNNPVALVRTHRPRDLVIGDMPEGIVMTSSHWSNWAHFLTEQLPKMLVADQQETWRTMPFLTSAMGLGNAERLARRLVANGRQIIRVSGRVRVARAAYVSSIGYCPFEYRLGNGQALPDTRPTDALFSPIALDLVRQRALAIAGGGVTDSARRRIYLKRNSKVRQVTNGEQLESRLVHHGFAVVAPERLSVEEQIRMFSTAGVIVGQAGAALANMVFSPSGASILAFTAKSGHSNPYYFTNMAHALGHRLEYLFCQPRGNPHHPAHADLEVDLDALDIALESLLETQNT
jgi:capsular polysaccharide biosynthesis protein